MRADPAKLHQVLLNLVTNAIKFTHAGKIKVTARPSGAKGHVRFEIRDTGIGICKEVQKDLFQKFVQAMAPPPGSTAGSGLGLAICKNLVGFMGGQFWLASAGPGQGTTGFVHPAAGLPDSPPLAPLEDRERACISKARLTATWSWWWKTNPRWWR